LLSEEDTKLGLERPSLLESHIDCDAWSNMPERHPPKEAAASANAGPRVEAILGKVQAVMFS
jgi:hypothetical protein